MRTVDCTRFPVIVIGFVTATALAGCTGAPISGELVDYRSGEPVAGARVTLMQRGWGFDGGQLVWDRAYTASTQTGADGRFRLQLPAPLLAGRDGSLVVEASGYQRLTEVRAKPGAQLRLQSVPTPPETVPGGIARIGLLADGRPFGWSFIENRSVTDAAQADIFPELIQRSPLRLGLTVPAGGGVRFVSEAEQGIATSSYGHLLRYTDEAPAAGYDSRVVLDGSTGGTVFVRTPYARYAKLAFDPQRLHTGSGRLAGIEQPAQFALLLPFAYNPRPGRALPFDPAGGARAVEPLYAAAAAELPADGAVPRIARYYRLTLLDESGAVVDRLAVRLVPDVPRRLTGCPHDGQTGFRYENLLLSYGQDGLPRVQVSVHGERFAFHSAGSLVSRRRPTVLRFQDYGGQSPIQSYELRLQESAEEAVPGERVCGKPLVSIAWPG